MMSNSNYIIGLQRLAKARSHCVRRHLRAHQETVNALAGTIAVQVSSVSMMMVLSWSWARDVNDHERDETEKSASRERDADNFSREETETRRWYVSRPRRRDRDHNPARAHGL